MLKILIAVDGSIHANRAIAACAKLSKSTVSLEASLINVRTRALLDPLFANDYSMITMKQLDADQKATQSSIIDQATRHAQEQGLPLGKSIHAFGNVAQEILRTAKEQQSDLIFLGTRGAGALSNMLMGSVAQKVLHDATVPVVLVK
jgi:nucleotide-binding universal stress UspA family protein